MVLAIQGTLCSEEHGVSSRTGGSGQHQQDFHKTVFVVRITAEGSGGPPRDRWTHE